MKPFIGVLFLSCLLLTTVYFAGCNKSSSSSSGLRASGKTTTLTLSATTVKKGAPLMVTVSDNSITNIRWTVTPSTAAHVTAGNGQAMILFGQAGTFKIKASYFSGTDSTDSITAPIKVCDTVYTPVPPANPDTTSLAGVQIEMTPMVDTTGRLVLLAQSNSVYDCFPTFIDVDTAWTSGSISIGFVEIISSATASGCDGVQNPAASYMFPQQFLTAPLPMGTYPISVSINHVYYQGTYTLTSSGYTFYWPYTSGVTISPSTITL